MEDELGPSILGMVGWEPDDPDPKSPQDMPRPANDDDPPEEPKPIPFPLAA
jgi:hypothetical protein